METAMFFTGPINYEGRVQSFTDQYRKVHY